MDVCSKCKRNIPDDLLSPIFASGVESQNVCGVCALAMSNKAMGIERKKFTGEMAEALRVAAVKHYEKTKQK